MAAWQSEVKDASGVTGDVRWNRWGRKTCEWEGGLTLASMLTLGWDEHTVVGRLEGVKECKGVGRAIQWAEKGIPAP